MKYFFYILVRSRKAFHYFDRCIDSILAQDYPHFEIVFIDDASGYTQNQKKHIKTKLRGHTVIFNQSQRFSLYNAYYAIHSKMPRQDAIVVNVDGDDWLLSPHALQYLASVYTRTKCDYTYGGSVLWRKEKELHSLSLLGPHAGKAYPNKIIRQLTKEPFRPTHLRTWKVTAFKRIPQSEFKRQDGSWIKFVEDEAIFFPFLHDKQLRGTVLKKTLYAYNIDNPLSDKNINLTEKLLDEVWIRTKNDQHTRTFLTNSSHLFFLPFLKKNLFTDLFYKLQYLLLKNNLIHFCFFSDHFPLILSKSFTTTSIKNRQLILHHPLAGYSLSKIPNPVILDTTSFPSLTQENYSSVLWTIVLCNGITAQTSYALKQLFNHDFGWLIVRKQ